MSLTVFTLLNGRFLGEQSSVSDIVSSCIMEGRSHLPSSFSPVSHIIPLSVPPLPFASFQTALAYVR